jgi:hypothetical protein
VKCVPAGVYSGVPIDVYFFVIIHSLICVFKCAPWCAVFARNIIYSHIISNTHNIKSVKNMSIKHGDITYDKTLLVLAMIS